MGATTGSIRILHVDDDPDFAELVATFLEREDDRFTVDTVTRAEDGLDRLADDDVDCIVSDHDMSGMNGIEFLDAVREEYPDLPFILFTGKGSEEVASEAISAGVTDYLQKGSGTDRYAVLANRITNAVERYRAEAEIERTRTRLEAITENSSDAILTIDSTSTIRFANPAVAEVFGYEPADLIGEPLTTVIPPRYREEHLDAVSRYLDTGERSISWSAVEFPARHRDGHEVPVSVSFSEFDIDGEHRFVGVIRDISRRVRMEEQLREREERFRQMAETIEEVVWMTDPEKDEMIYVNPAYEEIWGESVENLYEDPTSFLDAVHPEDRDRVEDALDGQATGEYDERYRITRPDGEVRWIHDRAVPIENDAGEVYRIVGIASDITEQKRRERELETEHAFIDQALDALTDVFYVVGEDGGLRRWNDRLSEVTGYTDEQIAEMQATDLFPEDEHDRITEAIEEALTTGDASVEAEILTADGTRIPYELTGSRLTDSEGDPIGLIGIGRDITERREYERKQNLRYEAIFNQTYQFTGLLSPDGTLLEANDTALEFGGLDREDVIDQPFWEAYWWQTDEETRRELREAIDRASDGEFVRYEVEVQGKDETVTIDFSIRPVTDEKGEVTYLIPEGRDITELKTVKERERELQRQNERLEEFASIVSHDLRNPLNVVEGRLDLARVECDSEHLEGAENALTRAQALIDDLLTLAREGTRVDESDPVSLGDTIEGCWRNVETRGATLRAETDRTIRADPNRLKQLLENLIRNAVEHGGVDVIVTVGDLEDGFYVADDGPGIPGEKREQVFEAGYSTEEDGTGFGLNIVREITEAHGWEIRVTDSETGGARFEITGVDIVDGGTDD